MKYFSLSYWFKIWLLTAQLINNQTKGITAKAINNKKSNKITTMFNWQNQELNFANTTMQTVLNDSSKLKQIVNQRNNHFHQNYLDKQSSASTLSLELEINLQKQQQNRKKDLNQVINQILKKWLLLHH